MSRTFVKRFSDLLKNRQGKEAMELFMMEDSEIISNNLSDVMPLAAQYLTESNLQRDQEHFLCCKTIVNTVARMYNPMETVLEVLEEIEHVRLHVESHVKFFAMLEPLGICLTRMINKGKNIYWCLEPLRMYIQSLHTWTPDDEEATEDGTMNVYREVLLFLTPLVDKAVEVNSKREDGSLLGDSLLSFLIFLHGRLSMTSRVTVEKELLEKMMPLTLCLTGDPLYFLDVVGRRYRNVCNRSRDVDLRRTVNEKRNILFESKRNISDLAYANFYFNLITKEQYWRYVPQVYNLSYILEKCTYLFHTFLQVRREVFGWKGLIFMENVIQRVPRRSVSSEMLELTIYLDIFKPIISIMILSDNSDARKKALDVFRGYIELFNMEARYSVLSYLYEIAEHSGLLSLVTGIFKSSITECLDSAPRNHQFLGKNMEVLLKKVCNLPHGSSSDVVEISDEIITALNLLRYLFIKDEDNETGIWSIVDAIENDYLKPLKEGIHMSKGYWRVKIKDLEHQKKRYNQKTDYEEMKREDAKVTLTVGGEQLPVMPLADKISFCHRALNGLDVMESILIRVDECISTGKALR
ncbi:Glomulin [Ooceraea biroi]|uniref:Glomulin n=1 Tax=Ooceraea biroi TaxID=2015173 RepID=A0A026WI51_OOCBI|nr:Glomulin [Ooceraea biroi]